jgi:hypothetical protein
MYFRVFNKDNMHVESACTMVEASRHSHMLQGMCDYNIHATLSLVKSEHTKLTHKGQAWSRTIHVNCATTHSWECSSHVQQRKATLGRNRIWKLGNMVRRLKHTHNSFKKIRSRIKNYDKCMPWIQPMTMKHWAICIHNFCIQMREHSLSRWQRGEVIDWVIWTHSQGIFIHESYNEESNAH